MTKRNKRKKLDPKKAIINQAIKSGAVKVQDNKIMPKSKKIKILAWGASPLVITGFGVVMKELLTNLFRSNPGKYEVRQVGINYLGDAYDPNYITGGTENGLYMQWPAMQAHTSEKHFMYGHQKFLNILSTINPADVDVVFLFEDPFWIGGPIPKTRDLFIDQIKNIMQQRGMGHVPIVAYYPIDGIPDPAWINNINKVDYPITYLNFGRQASINVCPQLQDRISVIPHGLNPKEFFPISKQEARTFKRIMFGDDYVDKFMCLNVNRNQLRKMLPATLIAFKEFQKQVNGNAFIYMNMRAQDVGWDLPKVCRNIGLQVNRDVFFPPNFNVQKGLPVEDLNRVFNIADMLVTSATGGGWEFAITQAFATKTAVVAPANTSHIELCGDQGNNELKRGFLYASGNTLSLRAVFSNDNEVVRPLPNIEDMIHKMKYVYDNPDIKAQVEENAYNWVTTQLRWDENVVPKFDRVFTAAYNLKQKRIQDMQTRAVQQNQFQLGA